MAQTQCVLLAMEKDPNASMQTAFNAGLEEAAQSCEMEAKDWADTPLMRKAVEALAERIRARKRNYPQRSISVENNPQNQN